MVNRVYVDSMLSSYLLQATDHLGLQAQNSKGEWVDCPQIPGTFGLFPPSCTFSSDIPNTQKVVAMGQGLEAMTDGVCIATTHRVLSPTAGKCSSRPEDPYNS